MELTMNIFIIIVIIIIGKYTNEGHKKSCKKWRRERVTEEAPNLDLSSIIQILFGPTIVDDIKLKVNKKEK